MENKTIKNNKVNLYSEESVFSRIIQFLFGSKKDSLNEKELKKINKSLKKQGFNFYSSHSEKVSGRFAEIIYSTYKVLSPIKNYFQTLSESEDFKNAVIRFYMTEKEKDLLPMLDENYIYEKTEHGNFNENVKKIKENFLTFQKQFVIEQIEMIDNVYSETNILRSFATIDFYVIVKKFCPFLVENKFNDNVKFASIYRKYVAENITDFCNSTINFLQVYDWKNVFEFLKSLPGFPKIEVNEFSKIVANLNLLKEKNVLSSIVKLVQDDNNFEITENVKSVDIVRPYLEEKYEKVKNTITAIYNEKKKSHIDAIINKIFPENISFQFKFYNMQNSSKLESLGCGVYKYYEVLGYLKAYLNLIVKEDCHEFAETLSVRGKGLIQNYIKNFVNIFHDLCDKCNEIETLDNNLDVKFPEGYKIKNLLDHINTVPDASIQLTNEVNVLNGKASAVARNTMPKLNDFYKMLQQLLSDCVKDVNDIIENWADVERYVSVPCKTFLEETISKTKYFIMLMNDFGFAVS